VSDAKPLRTLFTIVMDVLVVVAIAVTARIVVLFFGTLAAKGWAEAIVAITNPVIIPFGIESIKTPYGGVFDVDAALTVVVVLVLEWLLSLFRSRA